MHQWNEIYLWNTAENIETSDLSRSLKYLSNGAQVGWTAFPVEQSQKRGAVALLQAVLENWVVL